MILIDFSSISLAVILATHKQLPELNESTIKHLVLNSILSTKRKFGDKYGDIVICCDSTNIWRKQVFPYYKANRKKARENIIIDWKLVYNALDLLIEDLTNFYPYKTIKVDTLEADDVIAYFAITSDETNLIVSNDKDFVQLQLWRPNLDQYMPLKERMFRGTHVEILDMHMNHIIRGDAGDGIPNVCSDDDTFVNPNKRQKIITAKLYATILSQIGEADVNLRGPFAPGGMYEANLKRNMELISLSESNLRHFGVFDKVSNIDAKPQATNRTLIYQHLVNNRLSTLLERLSDF